MENGKWKYVLVDKYFPYIESNDNKNYKQDMFCFGSSFKDELWVSLIEKAWAKVNGCYARIGCGGECGDGFDVLTSAISEYHEILGINDRKKDELWEILKDAKDKKNINVAKNKKNNYVIGAGTRRLGFLERIWRGGVGLISCHAYTIINVYEYKDKYKLIRLVKLRNPWGEKEFNGDWSDKSSKWNDYFKEIFEFKEAKDDGIFYMSYEDFTYYFRSVEILKIKENYDIRASCKISKKEAYKMQIIKFKISFGKNGINRENKIKVFINLYQKNPRIRRKDGTYFPDPVKSFLILAQKISEDKYVFIKSKASMRVHFAIEEELEVDKDYIIFCDVNYRFVYDEIYGYNITFYCDKSYDIKCSRKNLNGKQSSEMLNKVLYNYYKNNTNNFLERTVRKFNVYRLNHYNEDFPFIILIIEYKKEIKPNDRKSCFKLDLNFDEIKNACIYNDSEASESDISVCKQIKNDYSIILLMGYQLDAKFSFTYQSI